MNDNTKKIYDILQDIFKNVWEQQKYAELKNGVMLTLNIAIFAILGRVFLEFNDEKNCMLTPKVILIGLMFLFVIHILIILYSYFPQNCNKENIKWTKDNINIFFFGDIRKLESKLYLELLLEKIKIKDEINNPLLLDLSNQVIILSEITQRKHESFKRSAYRLFGLILLFGMYFIYTFFVLGY